MAENTNAAGFDPTFEAPQPHDQFATRTPNPEWAWQQPPEDESDRDNNPRWSDPALHPDSPYYGLIYPETGASSEPLSSQQKREPGKLRVFGRKALRSFIEAGPIGAAQDASARVSRRPVDMISPDKLKAEPRSQEQVDADFLAHYRAAAADMSKRADLQKRAEERARQKGSQNQPATASGQAEQNNKQSPDFFTEQLQKIAENISEEYRSYLDPDYIHQLDDVYNSYVSESVRDWHEAHPEHAGSDIPHDIFRDIAAQCEHNAIISFLNYNGLPISSEAIKGFGEARYAAYIDRKKNQSNHNS